jgi:hypothetical protein
MIRLTNAVLVATLLDVVDANGKVIAMKCETRSATTLRRSGWSPEMFVPGASITVMGHPHRDDPTACTVETLTLGRARTQLTRGIVADDPVFFADTYVDSDSVLPADAPFRVEACKELAPEYQPTGRK